MWHTNWPFTPLHFVNGAMYFWGREGTAFSHCASCQCCWSLLFHAANNKACVRNAENPQITLTQVAQLVLTVYILLKSKLQQPGVKTASLLCLEWSSCWNCIPVHLPKNNICTDTIYWLKYQLTDLLLLISLGWRRLDTETTECQYNFTPFLWGSESRYMDNYFVSVVAVEGGERSEEVLSQTFSFNRVKPVDVMCKKTPSSGSLTDTHTPYSRDSERPVFSFPPQVSWISLQWTSIRRIPGYWSVLPIPSAFIRDWVEHFPSPSLQIP